MNQQFPLTTAGLTDPGVQRQNNEDTWGGPPPNLTPAQVAAKGYLYVVADGVGGHQSGEIASRMAVQITQQVYYADPNPDVGASLQAAIQEANRRIYHQGISSAGEYGMSTTITATVVRGNELVVANVGDSRTYLIHGGQAHQLTVDHTWVEERRQAGILTDEEATNHPQRNVITRSLGSDLHVQADISTRPHSLARGDQVLLCTDGLSDLVSKQEIAGVVTQSRSPNAAARRLVDLAKKRGAPDNVTAVVVSTERGKASARPERSNLVALAGILGAVALVAVVGFALIKYLPGLAVAPTATATSTPTASPTATVTPTPSPTATPLPAPELTGPEDGTDYYAWQEVTLAWAWPATLEDSQRFVIVVEDGSGARVLTKTVGTGEEMEYPFKPQDVNLVVGDYHWTVWVEQIVEGEWEEVAPPGVRRAFSVLPSPPTNTPIPPTPTPTPTPPPTETPKPQPKPKSTKSPDRP